MLTEVHDHIINELGQSSRTDTIFVVTAVIFNLIVLGINSGVSAAAVDNGSYAAGDVILIVFITVTILINTIAVTALYLGRRTRSLLLQGLVAMYHDNEVARYYSGELLSNYGIRYLLFAGVIIALALTAILVPLIIRFV
ncbi:MAG TPA: hypothetical protein G4N98_04890 [Thermoflexia bacterium]|nr:hypothetical protein [Thermoflexia bacterium]